MYLSIIETSPNGVFIANDKGKCIYCNPAFTRITGYSDTDVPTLESWFEKTFPDPKYRRYAMDAMATDAGRKKEATILLRNVCKNGSTEEIEFYPLFLKSGDYGIILQDVSHYVDRLNALEAAYKELKDQLKMSTSELGYNQKKLSYHHSRLATVNHKLMETNHVITVLAKKIEESRKDAEKEIALTIRSKIMPVLKNLQEQKDKKSDALCTELDILAAHLNSLTPCLAESINISPCLSNTEMRIATMIKNGLTSQQIADQLNISPNTVKTHRKHIREKLNIQNSNINLTTFLRSKMP